MVIHVIFASYFFSVFFATTAPHNGTPSRYVARRCDKYTVRKCRHARWRFDITVFQNLGKCKIIYTLEDGKRDCAGARINGPFHDQKDFFFFIVVGVGLGGFSRSPLVWIRTQSGRDPL